MPQKLLYQYHITLYHKSENKILSYSWIYIILTNINQLITKMRYGHFYAYYYILVLYLNCNIKRNLAVLTPVCKRGDLWPWALDSLWGPAAQNPLQ